MILLRQISHWNVLCRPIKAFSLIALPRRPRLYHTLKTTRSKKNKGPAKNKQLEQLGNMVATAIKDFADKQINLKVAETKVKCMLSNEVRRENIEICCSQDDIRQQNEEERRGREEIRREHEHKLAEWEQMQQNLRSLRQDLKDPLLDDDERANIQADIQRLQKRKNDIAKDLKMGKRGEGE
jgi:lysyl-tRNA synthetase class I